MKNIRKLKKNSYAVLITILFITAIVLLNIFTEMLTDRFFLRADLTETGAYTLSERAEEFLQTVTETVDIIVLEEESKWIANDTYSLAVRILQNYSAATGGRIRVQYVNPDLNAFDGPRFDNKLSTLRDAHAELEGMDRGDIVFVSTHRATRIHATDLFTHRYDETFGRTITSGVNADQQLVSSLSYVLNASIGRAVFVTNHQESPAEYLKFIFELSGYAYSEINLATDDIPEDTLLVISQAPKIDYLSNEIVKLEQYLVLGGSVMILVDFSTMSLPNLDAFLEQWGVLVENKIIFDEDHTYIPQLGIIGAQVVAGALPFTAEAESITTSALPMGVYLPKPLKSAWVGEASGGFALVPMIRTFSASSYAKDLTEGGSQSFERESGDAVGPFVLAYNVRRLTSTPDGNQVFANLFVSSAGMFEDQFLYAYGDSFYNAAFIAGIAQDLNPFGESVYIPAKALFGSDMPVSSQGARNVLVFMVIAVPLAIVTTGVLVWRKRRSL